MHPQQVGIVVGGDDDLAMESAMKMIMIMIILHLKRIFEQICLKRCYKIYQKFLRQNPGVVNWLSCDGRFDCFSLTGQEMRALEGN